MDDLILGEQPKSPRHIMNEKESPSSSEVREILKGAPPLGRRVSFYLSDDDHNDGPKTDKKEDDEEPPSLLPPPAWENVKSHASFINSYEEPGTEDGFVYFPRGTLSYDEYDEVKINYQHSTCAPTVMPDDLKSAEATNDLPHLDSNSDSVNISYDGAFLPSGLLSPEIFDAGSDNGGVSAPYNFGQLNAERTLLEPKLSAFVKNQETNLVSTSTNLEASYDNGQTVSRAWLLEGERDHGTNNDNVYNGHQYHAKLASASSHDNATYHPMDDLGASCTNPSKIESRPPLLGIDVSQNESVNGSLHASSDLNQAVAGAYIDHAPLRHHSKVKADLMLQRQANIKGVVNVHGDSTLDILANALKSSPTECTQVPGVYRNTDIEQAYIARYHPRRNNNFGKVSNGGTLLQNGSHEGMNKDSLRDLHDSDNTRNPGWPRRARIRDESFFDHNNSENCMHHRGIFNEQKEFHSDSARDLLNPTLTKNFFHAQQKFNPSKRTGICPSFLVSLNKGLSSAELEKKLQCHCGEKETAAKDEKAIFRAFQLAKLQCGPEAQKGSSVKSNLFLTKSPPEMPRCSHEQRRIFSNQWISSSLVPTSQAEQWGSAGQDEVDGTVLELPARVRSAKVAQNTSKMTGGSPPVESFKKFRSLDFQLRFENVFSTDSSAVVCPLPFFNWAESNDVWEKMLKKEQTFQRDPGMFKNHPELQPRMRSILLDWLSEVCEVYRLHKETFMLAVDFIDRYLSVTTNVPKTQLQLLGISALFVAAKLEEIYPPKLTEFAYVTDSACTEQEIIKQEMIIVKALKWDLTPITTNAWLSVYLQVANIDHIHDPALGFVFPQFSTHAFIQISRLCDLCVMDAGSLQFRYSRIAAAALYHHTNENVVKEVSGLNWADLYPCVRWMAPFAKAILEVGQSPMKFFPQINNEDAHNIQTHNVDMTLLDRALTHQAMMDERECLSASSPLDLTSQLVCLLEPPFPPSQSTDRNNGHGSDLAQNLEGAISTDNTDIVIENAASVGVSGSGMSSSSPAAIAGGASLETERAEGMEQQRSCS
ncbi:G1/S-specific cyclin-E-like [Elysia marginata]|uniref:G1/S-specific cyclin-E-like n=1 Tax=Elysia marginata TaxID=1093978 RepID=A0AAV4GNQ5_9GAST|nr:G1/S-specific cyclin-E-like [Elysia marginata]